MKQKNLIKRTVRIKPKSFPTKNELVGVEMSVESGLKRSIFSYVHPFIKGILAGMRGN